MTFKLGILTVSDRASRNEYDDRTGPVIREIMSQDAVIDITQYLIVPDDVQAIRTTLIDWADNKGLHLILTNGGTGFTYRDVTPEATKSVVEKEAPGLVYAMLRESLAVTPHAMLSRSAAGIRGITLIVNLPGSPKAARENLLAILPAIPHALELLSDSPQVRTGHNFDVGHGPDIEPKGENQ